MKKIIAFLLFVVFLAIGLLSTFPRAARADDATFFEPVVEGKNVADGIAITYVDSSGRSECKLPSEKDGKPVVEIGETACADNVDLSYVFIPSSVKRIGKQAFLDCSSLMRIDLLNGAESIGDEAFRGCSSLKVAVIPSSVKEIGAEAFAGCASLERIELLPEIEEIGNDAFKDCPAVLCVYQGSNAESWARENHREYETLVPPKTSADWRVFLVACDLCDACPDQPLYYAENDAKELRQAFLRLGVPEENITLLTSSSELDDERATYENIKAQYAAFCANVPEDSIAFVCLSGHGYSVPKDGRRIDRSADLDPEQFEAYYVPKDWSGSTENRLSIAAVLKLLSETSARFKWLCVDACRTIPSAYMKGGDADETLGLPTPLAPEGVLLTQSCSVGEFAREGALYPHGIFTNALINVLRGSAPVSEDGAVTALEMRDYLENQVRQDVGYVSLARGSEKQTVDAFEQNPTFAISEVPDGKEDEFWRGMILERVGDGNPDDTETSDGIVETSEEEGSEPVDGFGDPSDVTSEADGDDVDTPEADDADSVDGSGDPSDVTSEADGDDVDTPEADDADSVHGSGDPSDVTSEVDGDVVDTPEADDSDLGDGSGDPSDVTSEADGDVVDTPEVDDSDSDVVFRETSDDASGTDGDVVETPKADDSDSGGVFRETNDDASDTVGDIGEETSEEDGAEPAGGWDETDGDVEETIAEKTPEESVDVDKVATPPTAAVEWRVFLVGVKDYDAGFKSTYYSENDAKALRQAFLNLGVPEENITLLTSSGDANGGEATAKNINAKYDEFVDNLPEGSCAFVFFAGHGFSKWNGEGSKDVAPENYQAQLMPKDALWTDNLVSVGDLVDKLSHSKAQFKWICVDACRVIVPEEQLALQKGDDGIVGAMLSPEPPAGLLLMQSCALGQYAGEGYLYEHGLFTNALLEVLKGEARLKSDERVATLRQIRDYLLEKVPNDAKRITDLTRSSEKFKEVNLDQTPTYQASSVPTGEEEAFWDTALLTFKNGGVIDPPGGSTHRFDYRILVLAVVVIAALWFVPKLMRSRAKSGRRHKGKRRAKPTPTQIVETPAPIKPVVPPPAPKDEPIVPPPAPKDEPIVPPPAIKDKPVVPQPAPVPSTAPSETTVSQLQTEESDEEQLESDDKTIELTDDARDDDNDLREETFNVDDVSSSEISTSSESLIIDESTGNVEPQPVIPPSSHDLEHSNLVDQPEPVKPSLVATRKAGEVLTVVIHGQKTRFRWCPAGTFLMGSPEDEERRKPDERQRVVTLSRGFWIAESPTNQSLWSAIMGWNPSRFTGDPRRPVERVEWKQCTEFIDHLNAKHAPSGLLYALPTEAQWEYACRAGTTTPFSFGGALNGVMANCNGCHPYGTDVQGYRHRETTKPGLYFSNPWGIFDMHGNVWEWCHDWYGEYMGDAVVDPQGPDSGEYRVVRGGSWHFHPRHCRSASRYCGKPHARKSELGFRLVLLEIGD